MLLVQLPFIFPALRNVSQDLEEGRIGIPHTSGVLRNVSVGAWQGLGACPCHTLQLVGKLRKQSCVEMGYCNFGAVSCYYSPSGRQNFIVQYY